MNKFALKFCLPIIILLYLTGCNIPKSNLNVFNEYYRTSDFNKAMEFAQSKISKSQKPRGEDLLWSLQVGAVQFLVGDYNKSAEYFDKSEEMLNFYDYQDQTTAAIASTIVNDNAVPYLGEEYDGVMVNTYKALGFIIRGKHDLARVEFNRGLDRQRRAKELFAKEIAELKNQTVKDRQGKTVDINETIENPEFQKLLKEKYPSLSEYQAYPDFVNPFTTYLAGVYFNLVHDSSKAIDLLKESHGMVPDNRYIKEDLTATENHLDGRAELENTVWVIFENGLCPIKEEFRIDLPLFVVTDKVKYAGIALPKLKDREQAYPYLIVNVADKQYRTEVVADMDRVIQTEFSKDFEAILTRAVISATIKAVAQYALEEQNSQGAALTSMLMAAYSFATTAADVRIWSTLPKDFQTARLQIPPNRTIMISSNEEQKLFDINIPACKNAIVYVKIPSKEIAPTYIIMIFKN